MFGFKELYLMLTEQCPNRCEYCYIKGRANPKSMSVDQIDKIIAEEKPDRIIFFGGEPLVRLDLLEETVKKYYGKIKFQIVTSTSINFKEFLEFNKKYPLNEVQLSWDGFSDKNRIDASGNSISKTVWDNILYAAKTGLVFDIKCVVGNENIDIFPDIHKTFVELHTKYPNVHGEFVIAHRKVYTENYLKKFKDYYKKTFGLDYVYYEHLNRISAILNNDKNYASCDAGKYEVITPYGKKCFCTALSQEVKDFSEEELQRPCLSEDCKDCKYSCVCDGGCRYERVLYFGDEWKYKHTEAACQMAKIIYETITEWLDSLTFSEYHKLYKIIQYYHNFEVNLYTTINSKEAK